MGVPFRSDSVKDEVEFPAVITIDETVNGEYGEQWHIGYKPLTFAVGGATGAMHDYCSTKSSGSRSKFGMTLMAYLTVFGDNYVPEIGAGHLVGSYVFIRRATHEFGKDRTTKEPITTELYLPIRQLTDTEKLLTPPTSTTSAPVIAAASPQQLTAEDVLTIAALMHGIGPGDAVATAARSGLPPHLKASVMSGELLPTLVDAGYLEIQNGVYLMSGPAQQQYQIMQQAQAPVAAPPVAAPVAPVTAPLAPPPPLATYAPPAAPVPPAPTLPATTAFNIPGLGSAIPMG